MSAPGSQFESFVWKGQTRYRCTQMWEGGSKCEYDTYDLAMLKEHIRGPHTLTGKPHEGKRRVVSPLVDSAGKPIIHEVKPDPPSEFDGYRFKA